MRPEPPVRKEAAKRLLAAIRAWADLATELQLLSKHHALVQHLEALADGAALSGTDSIYNLCAVLYDDVKADEAPVSETHATSSQASLEKTRKKRALARFDTCYALDGFIEALPPEHTTELKQKRAVVGPTLQAQSNPPMIQALLGAFSGLKRRLEADEAKDPRRSKEHAGEYKRNEETENYIKDLHAQLHWLKKAFDADAERGSNREIIPEQVDNSCPLSFLGGNSDAVPDWVRLTSENCRFRYAVKLDEAKLDDRWIISLPHLSRFKIHWGGAEVALSQFLSEASDRAPGDAGFLGKLKHYALSEDGLEKDLESSFGSHEPPIAVAAHVKELKPFRATHHDDGAEEERARLERARLDRERLERLEKEQRERARREQEEKERRELERKRRENLLLEMDPQSAHERVPSARPRAAPSVLPKPMTLAQYTKKVRQYLCTTQKDPRHAAKLPSVIKSLPSAPPSPLSPRSSTEESIYVPSVKITDLNECHSLKITNEYDTKTGHLSSKIDEENSAMLSSKKELEWQAQALTRAAVLKHELYERRKQDDTIFIKFANPPKIPDSDPVMYDSTEYVKMVSRQAFALMAVGVHTAMGLSAMQTALAKIRATLKPPPPEEAGFCANILLEVLTRVNNKLGGVYDNPSELGFLPEEGNLAPAATIQERWTEFRESCRQHIQALVPEYSRSLPEEKLKLPGLGVDHD